MKHDIDWTEEFETLMTESKALHWTDVKGRAVNELGFAQHFLRREKQLARMNWVTRGLENGLKSMKYLIPTMILAFLLGPWIGATLAFEIAVSAFLALLVPFAIVSQRMHGDFAHGEPPVAEYDELTQVHQKYL